MGNVEYEITPETEVDFRLQVKCNMGVGVAKKLLYIVSSKKKDDKDIVDVPCAYFNYIKSSFAGLIANIQKELSEAEKKKILLTYYYIISAKFQREEKGWFFLINMKGTYV